jgi:hypothetical protein
MPPPNHQTGWPAVSPATGLAMKKRTFMCTVGTYGLRGCSTSDTPIASKPRPASSGRPALADGVPRADVRQLRHDLQDLLDQHRHHSGHGLLLRSLADGGGRV